MIECNARSGALRFQFEPDDRVNALGPASRAPRLHDALVRNELDISPDDEASEHFERRAGFATDLCSSSRECRKLLVVQQGFVDPMRVRRQVKLLMNGAQIVRAYLSRQHFDDIENSCPMVALPSDVARSGKSAKRAFETVLRAMARVLEQDLGDSSQSNHTTATAIGALCVGGMVIARSIDDRALADEVRDASMAVALSLGRWKKSAKQKRQRARSTAS